MSLVVILRWLGFLAIIAMFVLFFCLYFAFGISHFIDTSTHYENRKNKKKKK